MVHLRVGKKLKLRHVARDRPRWAKELSAFGEAYAKELRDVTSDRVAVIVGVSLVERAVEMTLRHFLVARGASQSDCDSLLTDDLPPLGSFFAKTRLAKCLGLIESDLLPALDSLRTWRNHFAHEPVPESLAQSDIDDLWGLFPQGWQSYLLACAADWPKGSTGTVTPRHLFCSTCSALSGPLISRADEKFGAKVPGKRT